jgi:hypothetical protein
MPNVRRRRSARNSLTAQPDLFSWRPAVVFNPLDHVARKLAARFGLSLAHAATIARLSGLGGSEVRQ